MLLLIPPYSETQVIAPRELTATTTWQTAWSSLRGGAIMVVDKDSTGSVWFVRYNGTCTEVSGNAGTRISRASGAQDPPGWFFDPYQEGYSGQVCVKSESGSVILELNEW